MPSNNFLALIICLAVFSIVLTTVFRYESDVFVFGVFRLLSYLFQVYWQPSREVGDSCRFLVSLGCRKTLRKSMLVSMLGVS